MKTRIAFAGFRHGHILTLYRAVQAHPERAVVAAACEEDPETRSAMIAQGIDITHDSLEEMLDKTQCDAVAVGDCYDRRGPIALEALQRGLHVISDKPVCTRLTELQEITALCRQRDLRFGCMFTRRDSGVSWRLRELFHEQVLGSIQAITFGGQHPLLWGKRPSWYFEAGKHGGTINDIGIHALDLIPWMTGLRFTTVVAARCWNLDPGRHPHFKGGAQFMMRMDNGCGVMGDVSYLMPDKLGYRLPQYWRTTFFGAEGMLEVDNEQAIMVGHGDEKPRLIEPLEDRKAGFFLDFLDDIAGLAPDSRRLTTDQVLESARISLLTQQAADDQQFEVTLD